MNSVFVLQRVLAVLLFAPAIAVGPSARATDASLLSARPPAAAACNAWREHLSDLIDQHRIAHEIDDDALFDYVRQFIAARDACSPGGYETGLRMYELILLGPVQRRPMK